MEQQVAAMFQEVQTLRQMLAQQEQRHAQEIQRLQDKIMTTKPSCWGHYEQLQELQVFSAETQRSGTSSPPSSAVRLRQAMEVWLS